MERKMSQISLVSEPSKIYFLQVFWEKELSTGFTVSLTDGLSVWTGKVSEVDISREAEDMAMEKEKYMDELRKALVQEEGSADTYNFDFCKESGHFFYEKSLRDVSFQLGSVELQEVSSPDEAIRELIGHCFDCITKQRAKNKHLQKENERLLSDWNKIQEQLEKYVNAKEVLEADLYNRFVLVLNEKKAKIRSLQKLINEGQAPEKDTQSERDMAPKVQNSPERDGVYDETTDEESENKSEPSAVGPATSSRKDSIVLSPDVPDIAPSRKRRYRMQKNVGTEPKVSSQEPQPQEKKKLDPSVHQISGSESFPTENLYLETLKNSSSEDLFDDV
ncbi:DNA repair protein XRCC4 [Ornithorhynchus anatinus]|nr:DNA repair protein XRCC4 [Ornithorhynchus anatinus]XP_028916615.1 DNA repair protein XRCC4 [Ornithorhynchus anatinus]XP_028916622.1 DNA repair protein XRCC4 [Ornithorhynchus anatinus]XP_028916629.1 DNA repair protein XRCC4 [Ornithorhynchus anatinus]XP_039767186.1 DNA repair protein XRCC4 [Ornithorhynchus anatinus]